MRPFLLVLVLLASFALPSGAPFVYAQGRQDKPWNQWRYWRSVELDPNQTGELARITVPAEVYARARPRLADLRLVDDAGQEVPYVLYARRRTEQRQWRATRLEDLGYVEGQYTQAIADLGDNPEPHNTLTLDSGENNFFAWVEVASSDDRRAWVVVRDAAPIYRFRQDQLEGNQVVTYPDSRARYLRLRVRWQEPRQFQLVGCRVAQHVVEEAERAPWPATLAADTAASAKQTAWIADLGAPDVPVAEVRFETPAAEFHRPVQISASNDAQQWWPVGSGEIYRLRQGLPAQGGGAPLESLRVEFSETETRYLRVAVFNRNDPPLENLRAQIFSTPRHLVFRPQPAAAGRSYRLLYGNIVAEKPEYELARLLNTEQLQSAPLATLGPEQATLNWADPRPWTEQHPWLLWAALALAVVALGALALRSLRKSA
ncbi:MAG: DUF3999 family protein [Candidatus Acidiferrales bacterium]